MIGIENNCLIFVIFLHEFQRNTRDGRLEISLFSIDHQTYIHILSCLFKKLFMWQWFVSFRKNFTLTSVFNLLIIFLNISSSFGDNCVIKRTIRPVFKSGTRNVLLNSWFSSMIPDHGNKCRILYGWKENYFLRKIIIIIISGGASEYINNYCNTH